MTLVKEVADAIKMLGDVVKSSREIVDAVSDGKKFLKSTHPGAQQDFAELLRQMHLTVVGLAEVTRIVSGFRFVAVGSAVETEPVRFNDYVIAQKSKVAELKGHIRELKADCEKVRGLRDALDARTVERPWGALFGLVGVQARERAGELASALSNFYADDQAMIGIIQRMLTLNEQALKDVEEELGPAGLSSPHNVASAATVLHTYAVLFQQPQTELDELADALHATSAALTGN